jgi:hypothetical protein
MSPSLRAKQGFYTAAERVGEARKLLSNVKELNQGGNDLFLCPKTLDHLNAAFYALSITQPPFFLRRSRLLPFWAKTELYG